MYHYYNFITFIFFCLTQQKKRVEIAINTAVHTVYTQLRNAVERQDKAMVIQYLDFLNQVICIFSQIIILKLCLLER